MNDQVEPDASEEESAREPDREAPPSPGRRLWLYALALLFAALVCVTVPLTFWPWFEARQDGFEPIGAVTTKSSRDEPTVIYAFGPGPSVEEASSYKVRLWVRSGWRWKCRTFPVSTKRVFFLLRHDGEAVLVTGEPDPTHPSAKTFKVHDGEVTPYFGSIGGRR